MSGAYLHFNRVDMYKDFQGADAHDGEQLPSHRDRNTSLTFAQSPDFSASDYYDRSRTRTYACCFSLEMSDHIWRHYGNGGEKGKICIVLEFDKLRPRLNQVLRARNSRLEYGGRRLLPIFSINYGLIKYVDKENCRIPYFTNPIKYTYIKDKCFENEKEFRVSLSAVGIGSVSSGTGGLLEFPPHLHFHFDFREAMADRTIQQIDCSSDCDHAFLKSEMNRLGIETTSSTR
ncbi:DUF2971 domain-containing protein [bacterium]|nr:DUF2971 domain-containing protein [bacterium]